jgi:hypothetical protein
MAKAMARNVENQYRGMPALSLAAGEKAAAAKAEKQRKHLAPHKASPAAAWWHRKNGA